MSSTDSCMLYIFYSFNEVWLHCHSIKYKALFEVSVVFMRAPKDTHNALTKQGKIPEICSFQTLWNIDSTLSVPQEEEILSLLALACLQAPGELTSASQYFHAEKNHSWGGKNPIIRLEEVSDANAYLSLFGKMKNREAGYSRQVLQYESYKGTQKIENSVGMETWTTGRSLMEGKL